MAIANPYGEALGARKPLDALADTPAKIRQRVDGWTAEHFEDPTRRANGAFASFWSISRRPNSR